jgi:predicted component of type VI protein secretion system
MLQSIFRITFLLIAFTLLWGCAGSAAKPKFAKTIETHKSIDGNDIATVNVQAAEGVKMRGAEMQRLKEIIQLELATKQALNASAGEADDYDVNVVITQYEKGNAFARAMLAGLGQIHIDATVTVVSSSSGDTASEFTVKKTFAWGGLYGGVTGIEEVEPAFAEGVAAGVTGQTDTSEKKKKKER